jgi:hypothetical protein
MKTSLIFTVIGISVGYSVTFPAIGCEYPCRNYYKSCLMSAEGTSAQCKMLYLASAKEGGVWGSPDARTTSRTKGSQVYCHVDFE